MRGGDAKPRRAARLKTTADRQEARGLSPRAFPAKRRHPHRAKAQLSPGQGEYPKPVALHPTAQRLQDHLHDLGLDVEIRELSDSTRTAQQAANAVGVGVGQIVKSLVFVDANGPLLCLCAGDRRVDTAKLGDGVRQAKGDEVREATGFAIGGVPPLAHDHPVRTVVDASLRRFETVWCAGGTPHAVFPVGTEALIEAIPAADVREIS